MSNRLPVLALRSPKLPALHLVVSPKKPQRKSWQPFWQKAVAASLSAARILRRNISRDDCAALTKSELDLILMGQIMAGTHVSRTMGPMSQLPAGELGLTSSIMVSPFAKSRFLCFMELGSASFFKTVRINNNFIPTGKDRFKAAKDHYLLSTRCHGNTKKLPANSLSFRDIENVKEFLHEYAEANAILLAGCIPGYKREDLQLLPSSTTKKVHLCMPEITLGV